jgi:exosortase/archaeosortase family protein
MASNKKRKLSQKGKEAAIRPDEKQKNKEGINIWRFALTYLVLMGSFFVLISLKPIQKVIDLNGLYTKGVVILTSKILAVLSVPSTYQGSIIQLPSIALDVKFGCNGLEAVMIYSVAVIAFPASWKNTFLGILGGFGVIQVINILRISALAYSAIHFKNLFETIHIYIAQGMMVAISLGVFFIYLNYAKSPQRAIL